MDIILYNGKVMTMDKNNLEAEAVAIKGNKIIAVGKDDEIVNLKTVGTKVVDLNGKTVVPGFIDSHMHALEYAKNLENINLTDCRSIDEIKDKIKNVIEKEKFPKDKLIIGTGWNDDLLLEKRYPTKKELDLISEEQPIIIIRHCVNIGILNTKAIEKFLPILNKISQTKKGIIKDENGDFTGLLKGNDVISIVIPPLNKIEIKNALLKTSEDCIKNGITSIQTDDFISADMEDILDVYFELDKNNKLPIRIYKQLRLPTLEKLEMFLKRGYKTGDGNNFYKIGPVKLVIDGTLGARTSALREPYSDDPNNTGICIYEQEELNEIICMAHKNDLQIAIHAIGDKAIDMVLKSYDVALKKYPKTDPRFRIIHSQITTEDLIDKYKKYNVIADVQALFVSSDLSIVESRIGKERAKWTYNWKTYLERGIHMSAGSDSPVESFNPLLGIYAFVTRQTLDGCPEGGWLPDQKLTVEEAVYAYTMGSSYCSFEENIKGSIEPNKLADIVILSDDIFSIDPNKIKDVKVEKTIIDGKIVYEK